MCVRERRDAIRVDYQTREPGFEPCFAGSKLIYATLFQLMQLYE